MGWSWVISEACERGSKLGAVVEVVLVESCTSEKQVAIADLLRPLGSVSMQTQEEHQRREAGDGLGKEEGVS